MSRKLLTTLLVAAGVAVAPAAQASVLASTGLNISNMFLVEADSTGGYSLFTGATVSSGNRNSTISVTWNGANSTSSDTAAATGDIDLSSLCSGPGCLSSPIGENDSATMLSTGAGYSNFVSSDSYLNGSALSAAGASGMTRADGIADPDAVGASNSELTNNLLASIVFSVDSTHTLAIIYEYLGWALAEITPDLLGTGSSADASTNWSITLKGAQGTVYATKTIDSLVFAANAFDVAGANSSLDKSSGTGVSDWVTLGAGTYQILFTQKSAENITAIPEPASLALVGLGLFGLGALRRRKLV